MHVYVVMGAMGNERVSVWVFQQALGTQKERERVTAGVRGTGDKRKIGVGGGRMTQRELPKVFIFFLKIGSLIKIWKTGQGRRVRWFLW